MEENNLPSIKIENLPNTIDDLNQFVLIGKEKLKIYQAKVKLIDKLDLAKNVRDKALEDTQKIATAVLYAEAKMGDLLKAIPDYHSSGRGTMKRKELPEGISKKQSHYSQQLANNITLIEEVIIESKKKEEIPTRTAVLKEIRILERKEKLEEQQNTIYDLMPIDGLFDIIVIDPPWEMVGFYDPDIMAGEPPYPTMSLNEIREIKIPAKKDAVIWLWAISAKLHDAFHLLEHWNFEYKNIYIWYKEGFLGLGSWGRNSHEHILLGVRGHPEVNFTKQSTVIKGARREHSRKPKEFYKMVEDTCFGNKLDFFSREVRSGWISYGDEKELWK